MKISSNRLVALVAIATLTGCATGPDYTPPEPDSQPTWNEGKSSLLKKSQTSLTAGWGDRQLSTLMAKAESNNRSLARARANLDAATAQRNTSRSALFPTVGVATEFSRARASETGSLAALPLPNTQSLYASGLNVSWEVDLFGYNRNRVAAANARLTASAAELEATRLAILAETALAYIEWAALAESIRLAEERLASQQETQHLVRARVESGLADSLEERSVSRDARLAESEIPGLRAGLAAAQYRLAVLTGTTPDAFRSAHQPPAGLPENAARKLPASLPAEVVRARPDVRAAERQLAAAYAELGMANADFYPRFLLTGGIGLESSNSGDLFQSASRTGLIRPAIHLPVFEGGRLQAQRANAEALRAAAQSNYEAAVLEALAEVETILADHLAAVQSDTSLTAAVADARAAEQRAAHLHQTGIGDLETLLTARRLRSSTDTLRIAARTATLSHAIRYHKAIATGLGPR